MFGPWKSSGEHVMGKAPLLMMAVLVLTGCSESVILAGNGASMLVACALLWSTVNLERSK